jgi:predicted aldo/keto reductase-like oxidoreductase
VPCTGCRYCTDDCPQGLNIPWLIELYNGYLYSGGKNLPVRTINTLPDDKKPAACIGCKSCEGHCPQSLPISETLATFAQKLAEPQE